MAYIGNSPGVASQRVVTTFTATSGQTTFTPSSGYTLGYCDVFLNGVKLVDGDDYTAANGVSVVLAAGASAGDSVEVVAYFPRGLSDGYLKAEADARFPRVDTASQGLNSTQQSNARTNIGAQAALGYTPVNKAGDTMTGPLYMPSLSKVGGGGYAVLLFGDNAAADDFHLVRESSGFNLYSGLFGSGTRRFGVDPSGRVTLPSQPAFKAQWANGSFNFGAGVTFWDQAVFNIGGHYNTANGRFTAPVTGTYHFVLQSQHYGGTTATGYHDIRLNGGDLNCRWEDANAQGNYNAGCVSVTVRMNAGDWVDCYSSGAVWWADNSFFCGYLVG